MTAPGTRAAIECPAASAPELEVRGLSKRFSGIPVLFDVSLTVGKAEAVALIGANGAGKSTLLRACLRLIEPDAGQVRLLSEDVRVLKPGRLRQLRARVGFVFQRHNLVPRLPVLSNVLHGALGRRALWRLSNLPTNELRVRNPGSCSRAYGLAIPSSTKS